MAQKSFGHSAVVHSTPKGGASRVHAKMLEVEHSTEQDITGETLSFSSLDDVNSFTFQQQSEDSAIIVSNRSSPVNLPVDDDTVPTPINKRIEETGQKAQDLIEKINQSFAMDQKVMNSFEEKLKQKVDEVCQQVKDQMFEYYEEHSQRMETRLAELSEVLQRCSLLSRELQGASQTLTAINRGLQQTSDQ